MSYLSNNPYSGRWRWDQGRLLYFQFENISACAKILNSLDGLPLNQPDDLLRQPLEKHTGLPFLPHHYKVWRNYARVFQCSMLATQFEKRLVVSDLCKNLASGNPFTPDEYLNFVFSHFQYPYPAFQEYNTSESPVFPFLAIIKLLIARNNSPLSLDDIFSLVIGNNCTGLEEITHYANLHKTSRTPINDELRQVREMLTFMGQASYLRWFDQKLYIDTTDFNAILNATAPFLSPVRLSDPSKEFLRLTSIQHNINSQDFSVILKDRPIPDIQIKEGSKSFTYHQTIERSPLLRKHFFKLHPDFVCDACGLHPEEKYPWLVNTNLLELHHILPLSSTLNSNASTTKLDDLRPLCPNCHRSVHIFYRLKLAEWEIQDFSSKQMALDVYETAKRTIV